MPSPTTVSHSRFKGVIQDVQISDGRNVTRIVEFFDLDFSSESEGGEVSRPPAIGRVSLFQVRKGVVSDDTCSPEDPCRNGGACTVTWNDYQ